MMSVDVTTSAAMHSCCGSAANLLLSATNSLSAGESQPTKEELNAFISTGRTGRRNAIPDILGDSNARVSTAGLAEQLQRLISEKLSTSTSPTSNGSTGMDCALADFASPNRTACHDLCCSSNNRSNCYNLRRQCTGNCFSSSSTHTSPDIPSTQERVAVAASTRCFSDLNNDGCRSASAFAARSNCFSNLHVNDNTHTQSNAESQNGGNNNSASASHR